MAERIGCHIEYIPFDTQTYDMDRKRVEQRVHDLPKACFVCHASNVTGQIYDVARLRGLL
ncbi:aminotransferase class V-fold PLP-dependent enzyme [Patescibacteria group bacterium]|nr:aminotransferase class V-fold PLP-dependent enzyme [Patescibacteria group bacterium]